MKELGPILDTIATGASALERLLPGRYADAAAVVSFLVGLGADIAASGQDPIRHVARIRSVDPDLNLMRRRWVLRANNNKTPG
jgi:hypothetical protein